MSGLYVKVWLSDTWRIILKPHVLLLVDMVCFQPGFSTGSPKRHGGRKACSASTLQSE